MGKFVGLMLAAEAGGKKRKAAKVAETEEAAEKVAEAVVEAVEEADEAAEPEAAEAGGKKRKNRPTKAELLEECDALGIEASPEMTNPELAELIAAAKE